ncbi:hypothetical protein ACFV14_16345 [Streptomyces zaomyceticus]
MTASGGVLVLLGLRPGVPGLTEQLHDRCVAGRPLKAEQAL